MEFRFTPEQESFRREVRAFLRQEMRPEYESRALGEPHPPEQFDFTKQFAKKLADRGWLTLAWPKEYGGMGADHMTQLVYNEEMSYNRAPSSMGSGISLTGPTLMVYGSEEQKKQHLPQIARAEVYWCQLFSEPGSGSDLASLQTRAVKDGDDYVINGQKIWTSNGHRADWAILLARTDPDAPKHRGISYFVLDMHAPGVQVQPLVNMLNAHEFNQVFMDNVRIPKENLVGEENRGWYVAATTLDFERSGVGAIASQRRLLDELIAFTKETRVNGATLFQTPLVRNKLANLAVELEVGRLIAYRVAWQQSQGLIPNYESSMSKLYASEVGQRLANTGVAILGMSGQLLPESAWAPMEGRFEQRYLSSIASTIAAGTSEIQRNIMATRGLGLPRG